MCAAPLLSPEDLAQQLSTIEVLLSIYQGSSEIILQAEDASNDTGDIILTSETFEAIKNLAEFLSLPLESLGKPHSINLRDALPALIQIGIRLNPLRGTLTESHTDASTDRILVLNVGFALRRLQKRKEEASDETLKPRWNLKHADWMDRGMHDALIAAASSVKWESDGGVDYVMTVIEAISEATLDLKSSIKEIQSETSHTTASDKAGPASSDLVLRSWYYLHSLSMKDKRKDLVSYAIQNKMTGFVLAGKPGLVALECNISEGEAHAIKVIDAYWSEIKTRSWSDLPSGHKKVSERHREVNVKKCFKEMKDITSIDDLGGVDVEEGGRIRTPDLDKLRKWLQQQGCTGQLDNVLGKDL